ncbi:unnamed protein product [Owenia fusiformis]|uniref:GB1/RHD3-type G domain-containing protein n=1 Tax=Owenia fusiformis TaxID=6347 RepID=A0A8S4N6Z6_OWEFU|nr:unnamed protein product [Owenia fusiformis]
MAWCNTGKNLKNLKTTSTHIQSSFNPHVHPSDKSVWDDNDSATRHSTVLDALNEAKQNISALGVAASQPLPEKDVRFMSEPMLFIECATQGWKVNDEAKKFLADLNMPLVIVSIVGPYRTGKSYLLNRFADVKKAKGFELGSTVQSKTKGIWMWCRPHPLNPGECIMLLDTEGLHDAEKGDSNHDNQIFALAILISSVFLYNTVGRIDNRAIEEMDFITHITDYIHVRSGQDQDSDENAAGYEDYQQIFPTFVWVLRDFMLSLEMDGERITANEYLGKMLELKPMPKHLRDRKERNRINDYNEPRERISSVFQRRECFVLRRPVDDNESLSRVNAIPECELNQEFVEQVDELCDFIKNECSTKHFSTKDGNIEINGPKLLGLAEMYTGTIQSGSVPCVERAIKLLAEMENTNAIDKAMELYRSIMSHHVDNSALSADTFESIHQNAMIESRKVFDDGRKFDNDGSYEERFQVKIKNEYCNYKERCERDREIMIQRAIEHGRIIYLQKMQNTIDDMPYSLEKLYLHESACLIKVFSTTREELSFLSDDEWEKEKKKYFESFGIYEDQEIYQKEFEVYKLINELIKDRMQNDPRERIERMMFRYAIYLKKDLPCGIDLIHTRHDEMETSLRIELKESFPNMDVSILDKLLVGKLEDSLDVVHLENENNCMKTDLERKQKEITSLQDQLKHTHCELDARTQDQSGRNKRYISAITRNKKPKQAIK